MNEELSTLSTTHSVDNNPQINPEVQEALSKRYGIAAIVCPLNNGKFAVFANDRSFDSLVICYPEDLPIIIASRSKMNPRKTIETTSSTQAQSYTANFDDL